MNVLSTFSLITFLSVCFTNCFAQYPFEKYPALKWTRVGEWKRYNRLEEEGKMHWTQTLPGFYEGKDSLTVQVTTVVDKEKYSLIRTYRNKKHQQTMRDNYAIAAGFGFLYDSLFYGDVNGDSLTDLKIVAWYGGNGIAALYERVIYLFQQPDHTFIKASFIDMDAASRSEHDLNNDGNYEIITMRLINHRDHNYWTFDLYNYVGHTFQSVNTQYDYPIMIQYLYRPNFTITNKLTREEMRKYGEKLPEDFTFVGSR